MGVTSYLVIDGEIISETRNGVESDYIPDPLGSTVALINSSGTITDTFTYWPYGSLRSHVGSSVTPFGYGGTLGYYTDGSSGRIYVENRIYVPQQTAWMTVDAFWPEELPYGYTNGNPTTLTDPTGNGCKIRFEPCKGAQFKACAGNCKLKSGVGICYFLRIDCQFIILVLHLGNG